MLSVCACVRAHAGHDEGGILMLEVQPAAASPLQRHSGGALAASCVPAVAPPAGGEPGVARVPAWSGEPVVVYKTRARELFAIQVRLLARIRLRAGVCAAACTCPGAAAAAGAGVHASCHPRSDDDADPRRHSSGVPTRAQHWQTVVWPTSRTLGALRGPCWRVLRMLTSLISDQVMRGQLPTWCARRKRAT